MSQIVETRSGQLAGDEENGVFVFRGVAYAEPPVGFLRWMPPEPVKPWSGVRSATEFGPVSHQLRVAPNELFANILRVPGNHSEDCLNLNVWTPGLDDAQRPVMVWIHPGGTEFGAGSQPNYDGRSLALRGDVVVVTINFRLGGFGFLNLNEVTDGRIPSTGNEGTLDQIAALEWVRDNIAAFGGDPGNVTIFGESSGSFQCATLLASPLAAGLFHRAILQSSAAHTAQTVESATRVARLFLKHLGIRASDVDAIRAITPEQIVQASTALVGLMLEDDPSRGIMHYHSVVDGKVLMDMPIEAIRRGAANDVSLLAGTNLDEKRIGLAFDPPTIAAGTSIPQPLTEAHIPTLLGLTREAYWTDEIVDTYRISREKHGEPAEPIDLLIAIETDRVLRIPTIRLLEAKQTHATPGFGYLFTYRSPVLDGRLRACHSLEMGFIFGTHDDTFCGTGPEADLMSRNMQDAWASFARTGDPSCESAGAWPAYGSGRETMVLNSTCELVNAPYDEERQVWDRIPEKELGLM